MRYVTDLKTRRTAVYQSDGRRERRSGTIHPIVIFGKIDGYYYQPAGTRSDPKFRGATFKTLAEVAASLEAE